ncbi:OB-fold putative lipoprotein [Bradyrhizobium elkanii]|uniref:tRNA_anti-like n=1 Tax=Bradyrhizobium elkanii TaxID=29448 RepID=A0ABV4FAH7_BRAEL|nr:OB-fold putative lipoprotein [Bradyrhizobium elkanii]MCP1752043.1 hypothetical protein [Bradyrhizobium elkanii]MCP1977814.1 hypothetical protein [Bradyrhizobium elkanii]MCS3887668.1 hypothetical protein [Bradyrhizobium elkanii]MCS4213313.1 hypothetical protein [Bradyrhizobium elkanii]MCW2213619.1 hypothetical protein [Bradyrhizobium elkanii]
MKSNIRHHLFSFFAFAMFALLAAGSLDTDSDTRQVQSQSPSYTLSADQLYYDYNANEVSADAKYKGKVVVVSGAIQNIGKDILGSAYITVGGKGFLDGAQCTFTKAEESSVARLVKGQRVSVKGEVSGKMGHVQINKCSLQ